MGYGNLRQWIEGLRKDKELMVIETPVDPYLELAEIHRRVMQEEGPALLFTNVKGSAFPVATNLFGTANRVDRAFGTRPERLMQSLLGSVESLVPPTAAGIWKKKGLIYDLLKIGTKNVPQGEAPVLGICRSSDPLKELPRITGWKEEGDPSISLALVYTEKLDNPKEYKIGLNRLPLYDDHTAGVHWQNHTSAGSHHYEAEVRGETMPVSVFIGGPPALMAAASALIPDRFPGLLLASLILGGKLPMVKDPMGGHRIPAEAEFAIRGLVRPYDRRPGNAPGGYYGYDPLQSPVMHVQRIWHRKDAIFPAVISGKTRHEDVYLSQSLQRLLAPAYQYAMPSVHALWTYPESGPYPLTAAVVQESYSREAMAAAFRILGEGQLSKTKLLLLTNEPLDPADFPKLMEALLERFNPATDLSVFQTLSQGSHPFTPEQLNHRSKAVMVGIGDPIRELPRSYEEGLVPGIHQALPFCGGCLTVSGASYEEDPELPGRLVAALREKETAWPLVILADHAANTVRTSASFLWTVLTHFNPATDLYAESDVRNHHIEYKLPLIIDARTKPGHPAELIPEPETVELVDRNWKNYFQGA
ncbi:UbiD family decarboxylase [Paenibacillus albidus]|uniref:UbiD family decarboxylase n=1 Tax=Paenibacillus albidus TaxID=2041023 RepID=UPI001BEBE02E|nr:UbiD family decarboxylase [Paenibacillus albidus]MBT2291925.1 UbiD family decarboxylase [Paenibacillus albidus]